MKNLYLIIIMFLFNYPAIAQELTLPNILKKIETTQNAYKTKFKNTVFKFEELTIMKLMKGNGEVERIDTTLTLITRKGTELVSRKIIQSTADTSKSRKSKEMKLHIEFKEDNPEYQFKLIRETDTEYEIGYEPRDSDFKKGQSHGKFWFDKYDFHVTKIKAVTPKPIESHLDELDMEINLIRLDNGLNVVTEVVVNGKASALLGLIKKQFQIKSTYQNHIIIEN